MKLNLGCGNKLLPGYLNVDVGGMGTKPDFVADIRDLPFADNSAEEVLAVHVLEHFYLWEVEAVLNEWRRVLHPGGVLDLEMPDFLNAAREFVAGNRNPQVTSWVFYGDPAWRDPNMVHRWLWWPEATIEYLKAHGWRNVRQERARFKLREPRDFRVVAEK